MSNRHLSRSIVLQTLFEWDFEGSKEGEVFAIFERLVGEFAPGSNDRPFMEKLLRMVLDKRRDIDDIIAKAAPDWPIDKISVVDRNVLRIGLSELIFADRNEVPPKV
ncbi:transcription antitermination protein NusB, partial [Candidatus Parcubacteria bacterium]|nr:transcription antitermination protein NusB [Candidatus Parcubacteria bacterium]